MKRKTLFLFLNLLLIVFTGFAQSPELLNYQAVIRNSSGEILANQSVEVQISIINNNAGGAVLYTESHDKTTNAYGLVNLVIGTGTGTDDFSAIDWAADKRFVGVKVDAGSGLTDLGAFQLLSVPYALHANSASNLGSENIYIPQSDTLFAVKDHDGNVVFAIFPDGVKVVVEEVTKGSIGGFAVSGRTPTKGETDIFRVTPDSTRVYVNDVSKNKGSISGFAVSGRTPTKGTKSNSQFMSLTPDNYFIGQRAGESITTGLYNIFLGYESGVSNQTGSFNTFLGYQSGNLNTASYNTFIGFESGVKNIGGENNVFLGHQTGHENTSGHENVFIGYRSGYSNTGGYDNIFIGNLAGENASGNTHSTFIGNEAGKNMVGDDNICIGDRSGYNYYTTTHESMGTVILGIDAGRNISGEYNTILGYAAGSSWGSEGTNSYNTIVGAGAGGKGDGNVYIGYDAGSGSTTDNKLFIDNSSAADPLIYGDFTDGSEIVTINGNFHVTGDITYDGHHPIADFVFESNYKLETIEEHAEFMWKEKHLPAVTSAKEIETEGKINMNERREQMLEELEKAHIYIEQLNYEFKEIKEENEALKQKLNEIIELLKDK